MRRMNNGSKDASQDISFFSCPITGSARRLVVKPVTPSSSNLNDSSLLRRFAASRDDLAFRELVEKYTGLVYGVAFRRTGDSQWAEEISQNVFLVVAKKADLLSRQHSLGPWLHRATTLEALRFSRKEATYQRHLAMLHHDQNQTNDQLWRDVRPLIDQLLNRLSYYERSIVVQHFIEGVPFAEIAQAIGISAAAAQKRSSRALEKLSRCLNRRGISISAVILASGLGTELGHAAPTGLADKISASVLSLSTPTSVIASTTAQIMASTKPLIATALVIATAFIPIGLQWQQNQRTNQPEDYSGETVGFKSQLSERAAPRHLRSRKAIRSEPELELAMREIIALRNPSRREAKFDQFMMSLHRDELSAVLSLLGSPLITEARLTLSEKPGLWSKLFARWVRLDPTEAITTVGALVNDREKRSASFGLLEGWIAIDPPATDAYIKGLPEGDLRTDLLNNQYRIHADQAPEEALDRAMAIQDPEEKTKALQCVMRSLERRDPRIGIDRLVSCEEGIDKQRWLGSLLDQLAASHPEEAFAKAMELAGRDLQRQVLTTVMRKMARTDPARGLEALASLPEVVRTGKIIESYGYGLLDLDLTEQALQRFENRDEQASLIAGAVRSYYRNPRKFHSLNQHDFARLRKMVEDLPAGKSQTEAAWNLAVSWVSKDADAALVWVEQQSRMDEPMKQKFAHRYTR